MAFSVLSSLSPPSRKFSSLLASVLPTLHVYDGVRMSRETLRVIDTLSESGVGNLYTSLAKGVTGLNTRLDDAGKVLGLAKS